MMKRVGLISGLMVVATLGTGCLSNMLVESVAKERAERIYWKNLELRERLQQHGITNDLPELGTHSAVNAGALAYDDNGVLMGPNYADPGFRSAWRERPVMGSLAAFGDTLMIGGGAAGGISLIDRVIDGSSKPSTTTYNITSGRDTTIGDSNTSGADSHDSIMEGGE